MQTLPPDLHLTRRTPEFTASTIPVGLLHDHRTEPGVWGMMIEERHLLLPGRSGIVEQAVKHQVMPFGPVRFHVEFHAGPDVVMAPTGSPAR